MYTKIVRDLLTLTNKFMLEKLSQAVCITLFLGLVAYMIYYSTLIDKIHG